MKEIVAAFSSGSAHLAILYCGLLSPKKGG